MAGKDRSGGIDIIEELRHRNSRKRSYEPRSLDSRWTMDVYEWDADADPPGWRIQGSEILEGVRIENGAAGISYTGP